MSLNKETLKENTITEITLIDPPNSIIQEQHEFVLCNDCYATGWYCYSCNKWISERKILSK